VYQFTVAFQPRHIFFVSSDDFVGGSVTAYDGLGNGISSAGLPNSSYTNPDVVVSVAGSRHQRLIDQRRRRLHAIDDVKYNATPEPGTLWPAWFGHVGRSRNPAPQDSALTL
jgi:hypothetical protein